MALPRPRTRPAGAPRPRTRPPAGPLLTTAVTLGLLLSGCAEDPEEPRAAASPSSSAAPSSAAPSSAAPSSPVPATGLGRPAVVATGLEVPWGLAFLPDGDALVGERDTARVLRIPAAGGQPVEVRTVPGVRPRGEGGLLGLAVSPAYARDGLVYAYLTAESDNRVVRFRLDGGAAPEPVITGIPKGSIHNGGRLAFGPDGTLYVGTGDTGDTSLAQDPGSLGGKVLRATADGEPVQGAASLVFSTGHRNVQGLAFDSAGRLWATEFGQNRFDEVNQVRPGDDGGWPEVEGAGTGGGRFAAPAVVWSTDEASPSGVAVVGDALYVAALRGQRLWRVPLDGSGGTGEPEALYEGEYGRLRTAVRAPDGALWVTTSNRDGRGEPSDDDDRVLRLPPA